MNIKQRRLPAEYQEVEWIKGDGNSWIDTLYVPNGNTVWKCVFERTENNTVEASGKYPSVGGARFKIEATTKTGSALYITLQGNSWKTQAIPVGIKQTAVLDVRNKIATIEPLGYLFTDYGTDTWEDTLSLFLFAYNISNNAKNITKWKIYSNIFSENGIVIQELVPCYRISDSVIGMYDLVGGQFYTNQGTGAFSKGADVVTVDRIVIPEGEVTVIRQGGQKLWQRLPAQYQEVEWIGSSGTQYIDTGVSSFDYFSIIELISSTTEIGHCMFGVDDRAAVRRYFYNEWYNLSAGAKVFKTGGSTDYIPVDTLQSYSTSYSNTFTHTLYLFSSNRDGYDNCAIGKIYSCQIKKSGVMIRDLVPCYRISDSTVGMYDTVNGVFYINQGTGTFTAGNPV